MNTAKCRGCKSNIKSGSYKALDVNCSTRVKLSTRHVLGISIVEHATVATCAVATIGVARTWHINDLI